MTIPDAKTIYLFLNILARDDIYLGSFVIVGRLEIKIRNLLFYVTNVEQN